ncbi:MAG: hypothetical protein ACK5X0_19950, partial [Rhodospirillales bacterium]
ALRHKHFDLPQLRDDLLGAMSFSGHLPGFLSKLIISISLAQENPVRSFFGTPTVTKVRTAIYPTSVFD